MPYPTVSTPLRENQGMRSQTLSEARVAVAAASQVYDRAEARANRAMRHLLGVYPSFQRNTFRAATGGSLGFHYGLMRRNAPTESGDAPLFEVSDEERAGAYNEAVEAVRARLEAWRTLEVARQERVTLLVSTHRAAPATPLTELARLAGMSYQVTRKTLAKHR